MASRKSFDDRGDSASKAKIRQNMPGNVQVYEMTARLRRDLGRSKAISSSTTVRSSVSPL